MSNFLFNGFDFQNELKAEFKLQNTFKPETGEQQDMQLSLLNHLGNGYLFTTNSTPEQKTMLSMENIEDSIKNSIFSYDANTSSLTIDANMSMNNEPTEDSHAATKKYVDEQVGASGTVKSITLDTSTDALNIVNPTVTDTGTISIAVSDALQNISDITTAGLVSRNTDGSYSTLETTAVEADNIKSMAVVTTDGILQQNSDVVTTLEVPTTTGQILTSNNGSLEWQTPASGGNVVGNSSTTVDHIAVWNNSTGTGLSSSSVAVDDLATQSELGSFVNKFRTGSVAVGDVGGRVENVDLIVTGGVLTARKAAYYSDSDVLVDITYANKGYVPLIFAQWNDTTPNSTANDINLVVVQNTTNTGARIYLEESSGTGQSGTLHLMLVAPDIA